MTGDKFLFPSIGIGIACAIGSFFYFENGLWLILNIVVSVAIGILIGLSVLVISGGTKPPASPGNFAAGFLTLLITGLAFWGLSSCFHISDADLQEKAIKKEEKRQQDELNRKAALERDIKEESEFRASGKDFEIYGTEDDEKWALIRAETALKHFVKDPASLSGVAPVSKPLRIRIKAYPACRYAIQVRFKAKNSFGAMGVSVATVLFDSRWNGIAVLEKPPYHIK